MMSAHSTSTQPALNSKTMHVLKRDGTQEPVSFDKVLRRLSNKATGLDVNVYEVAQKVCSRIYDGVKTAALDELAAQMCSSLIIDHPDYGVLASRIAISNHHKQTSPSFSETLTIMYGNKDIHGMPNPLISDKLYTIAIANKLKLNSYIDYDRDYTFDYFGFRTLEKGYLTRVAGVIVERPQHLWMRVALGIHGEDIKDAIETYDCLSKRMFIHATPTLFNAGTNIPQQSSCYLIEMAGDSVSGMYETLADCAQISKYAGGIGLHIHNIRARGSLIRGTNGKSSGIVPMLRVFNATARHIDQAGKRNGSIAVYLEPWHSDIEAFLDLKKNHGAEEERARDLFYALWIPDLFMERVRDGGVWSLMCPDMCPGLSDVYGDDFKTLYEDYEAAGKYRKQINALDLWYAILESQIETGTPYMLYKDAVNKKTNQQNLGTIKSSNLCVAPETRILTSTGYHVIADLVDKEVMVWNGDEFSSTTVRKTGESQKLMTVKCNNGMTLRCTPYHKFVIEVLPGEVFEIEASNLRLGDKLPQYTTPLINADANANANANAVLTRDTIVPINCSIDTKIMWLDSVLDKYATWDSTFVMIEYYNGPEDFLRNTQLLLQTLAIQTCIVKGTLRLDKYAVMDLNELGLQFKPTNILNNAASKVYDVIKIVGLEDNDEYSDTYCFTEPRKHRGIFNGLLTSQCTEIMEKTASDEIAVCNLASMALPTYIVNGTFDFDMLHKNVKIVTKNLNKVIDNNFYPVDKTERSNYRHRPIGVGVQGLADVFAILKMPFDSPAASRLNALIFETMYHAGLEASMEISKRRAQLCEELGLSTTDIARHDQIMAHLNLKECEVAQLNGKWPGAYSTFAGSPTSKGLLQYDLWNASPHSDRYDWADLKESIMKYGLRNSLLLAPMPTASTSQIMGFNEAFEAFTSNLYKRKTLAGEFVVANKYLMADLMELGLWNKDIKDQLMMGEGSVKDIAAIPVEIRERYKTVWEIKQKVVIDMAADRGIYVCQSQSMNLFVESPDFKRLSSMHFYAWQKGLKTGMYYLRTKPKANAQQFTVDPRKTQQQTQQQSQQQTQQVSPKLVAKTQSPQVTQLTKDIVEDIEDDVQQAVGCTWKPGCKTCSS